MVEARLEGGGAEPLVPHVEAAAVRMRDMIIAHDTILGDKYRLVRQLDEGAMGSVWMAEHVSLRSPVAIKLIAREMAETDDGVQRFFREARTAAALRNPHVVQILDYGVEQSVPYIVMELLEGEPLSERLKRLGRLSLRETEYVLRHVSRALGRAHDAGIVHRDLKPANVFIVANEEEELIKLLDFGIAKARVDVLTASMANNTRTGVFLGTPFNMSPEQVEGSKSLDYRADIWSLGVLAYECLLGALPFSGDTFGSLVLSICSRPLPIPSEQGPVPGGFDAWFARACARDPGQRFSSAREAASELRRLTDAALGSGSATSTAPSPFELRLSQMASAPAFPTAPAFPAAPAARSHASNRTPAPVFTETHGGASRASPPGQSGRRGNRRAWIGAAVLAVGVVFVLMLSRAGDSSPAPAAAMAGKAVASKAALSKAALSKAAGSPVKTGVRVSGEGGPLTLFVDGARVGVLPLEPVALEPGEHRIVISGGPRYADHEERILVERGRVVSVGPVTLKAKPVLAQHSGQAAASGSARPGTPDGPAGAALATLHVDSRPASRVLLDGTLLGVTPISDIAIEPGVHEVVFIHGVETQIKTIRVEAGKVGRLEVRF
jgi:eukaryotic-like serine/threonine-protein kinase